MLSCCEVGKTSTVVKLEFMIAMFRWKYLRIILAALLLLFIFLGVWAFWIEPNSLTVRQESIKIESCPQALNGLRLAVLSDIHAGSRFMDEKKLDEIVAATNQQQPELIVILGDFMGRSRWLDRIPPEVIAKHLKELRAPLGVFAVLGNHDWWFDGWRVGTALQGSGIRVLENDYATVQRQGQEFYLVGLSDAWTRPQHIKETVAKIPPGKPIIALTHNPDIFPEIPPGVSLTLAGHTHGGQVNFPIFGRIVLPTEGRYAAGYFEENGKRLFVTTGIGTSIVPVRFRVPPEIVLLTLKN
jgi:predicted MPP superfamily phosphohydrolase